MTATPPSATEMTGSDRLDFVVQQVWGSELETGDLRIGAPSPGWSSAGQYWVFPSARAAQILLPRQRNAAARSMLDYARLRTLWRTRLVRRTLGTAATVGLPLSRDVLTLTHRDGADPTLVQQLGELVGQPAAFATVGVRTGANAKPTLELRSPDGSLLGFAKLGWNPVTTAAVRTEAESLRAYQTLRSAAVRTPLLLASGSIGDRPYVLTEGLPPSIEHIPPRWESLTSAEAVGPGRVVAYRPLAQTAHAQSLRNMLHARSSTIPAMLLEQTRAQLEHLLEIPNAVPTADLWHGDYVPWNLGRDSAGALWLFDWETAQRDVPAGLDALHWFTNSQNSTDPKLLVAQVRAATQHASPVLTSLGYTPSTMPLLHMYYALTLVGRAMALADSLGSWTRMRLQPNVLAALLMWAGTDATRAREERRDA